MGKRKIGEIYNKPIVEGDKNLVTNNEIHKSELSGGNTGGGSADVYMEYFGEDAVTALSSFPAPPTSMLFMLGAAGIVTFFKSSDTIAPTLMLSTDKASTLELKGFAIVFGTRSVINGQDTGFITPEKLNTDSMEGFYDLIKDHKITKEEFYSLN